MTRSVALLDRIGWRPLEVRENLLIFRINVDASRRLTRLLINKLADAGVVLWPTSNDCGRPFMWVEFDPVSQDGFLYLVINDEVLPGSAKDTSDEVAANTAHQSAGHSPPEGE